MRAWIVAAAVVASLVVARPAAGELLERSGRFGGLTLTYKVLLPPGFDTARSYPVVLVFTGGAQQLRGAENTLVTDWQDEAARRGYIVISPAAPEGRLFFEDGDRVFPEFLDAILRDYKVRGGTLHIAGHSNGGLSAFHVAAKYPRYFTTVTGYPGLLQPESAAGVTALSRLCLFMHVGDGDPTWAAAMAAQARRFKAQRARIEYTVEAGQAHRLRAPDIKLSPRLFDEIESCR